jgi:long-chain acyl-CoA synthetase
MVETLCQMFQESTRRFAEYPAMLRKVEKRFEPITYREMGVQVRKLATALLSLGIRKGDRVALLSENRPEWAIADFAILHIGAVNVGIFPTLPAGQVEYIVTDSGARCLIVSDREQLTKALSIRKSLPALRLISMNDVEPATDGVLSLGDLMRKAESVPLSDRAYEEHWRSVGPEDWASIIYTSGTTAEPRGAILSHWNFVSNYTSGREVIAFHPGDILLSFVPLNHVYGRIVDQYFAMSAGSTVAYVENLRRLRQNMAEVRPHYMVLVPRVLEMFQEGLLTAISKEPPFKQKLFNWALAKSKELAAPAQTGKRPSPVLLFQTWFGDRLVFRPIRARLGVDRLKLFFSGGAPLSKTTGEFFSAMGLSVMEGYGLSETSPLVAVNPRAKLKLGTVGLPIGGIEVRLADDGEILVRGPNVMQGYYKRPEETKETIDPEGWLHTGDIGEFDEDGYLTITDRKKNLIVLANGKKVAPQHLENRLLESPFISQVVIVGDEQNTVGALIVPAFERVKEWAEKQGLSTVAGEKLASAPEVQRLIREEVQRLSGDFADYEKIRRFALLERELTVEAGELTPTLKIKRRVVVEKYKDLIDSLYGPVRS